MSTANIRLTAALKTMDMKIQYIIMTDQMTGHEIAELKIAGQQNIA